jgi:mRNA interferase MazF
MNQYEIYLVALDPTIGHEIKKTRPCVLISPNEMNENIGTVIIAPMTTKSHKYPSRIEIEMNKVKGWIILDQIRTVDKTRLIKLVGKLKNDEIKKVKSVLSEMLVE